MGLDVLLKRGIVPDETLDTVQKVSEFCKKHNCTFYNAEGCPAIYKTPFLVTHATSPIS